MGLFSWISALSGKSIPVETNIIIIKPDNSTVSGLYDGYGRIESKSGILDIFEIIANMNNIEKDKRKSGILINDNNTGVQLRMIRKSEYDNQKYNVLKDSKMCRFQGFFGSKEDLEVCQW